MPICIFYVWLGGRDHVDKLLYIALHPNNKQVTELWSVITCGIFIPLVKTSSPRVCSTHWKKAVSLLSRTFFGWWHGGGECDSEMHFWGYDVLGGSWPCSLRMRCAVRLSRIEWWPCGLGWSMVGKWWWKWGESPIFLFHGFYFWADFCTGIQQSGDEGYTVVKLFRQDLLIFQDNFIMRVA